MSDQYPLLNDMPIDKLRVKKPRQELKQRGLKAYGLKKEKLKQDIYKEKQVGLGEELHNENAEQSVPDNSELVVCVSQHAGEKLDNVVSMGNSLTENEQVAAQPELDRNVVRGNTTSPPNQDELASVFCSDSRVPAECSANSTGKQSPEKLDIDGSFIVDSGHDDMSGDAKASPQHGSSVGGAVADIVGKFSSGREVVVPESPKRKRKLKDNEDAWKSSKKKRRWRHSHRNRVPGTKPLKLRSMITRDAFKSIVPPSSKRATNSLRIDYFVRPFTLQQVQDLLAKTGSITSFWMDEIKTHCYVTYSSVEEAVATRNAVYYLKWPEKGESYLEADFVDPQEVTIRCENPAQTPAVTHASSSLPQKRRQSVKDRLNPPLPPLSKKRKSRHGKRKVVPDERAASTGTKVPAIALDKTFKMTATLPNIYYLPLSEEQVQEKLAAERSEGRRN